MDSRQKSVKVIEISGVPGSGKTEFIKSHFSGHFILLGGIPLSCRKFKRVCYSIILPFYAFATGLLSFRQAYWLIQKVVRYDETLLSRLNALRNSINKFGYHFFMARANADCIIDEGISHIPFILELEKSEIYCFVNLFHQHLVQKSIIFIETPPKEILMERLMKRGHKRIRSEKDVEAFVEKNIRIAMQYKEVLCTTGLDVTFQ